AAGGQGIPLGGAKLVPTPDYGGSFTPPGGTRPPPPPNGQPTRPPPKPGDQNPLAPPPAWTALGDISTGPYARSVPGVPHPRGSDAGSATGFFQATGNTFIGIPYGFREQYVLQVDAVQTEGGVVLSTGTQPGELYGDGSITVSFFADTYHAGGVLLRNQL